MDIDNLGDQGDETISLSDVLVARDSCLPEDELWALCRECCLVLEVVNNSPEQFQTLCVTPDTVAFDQVGNVCFLDLDVDPDPIYLPPEYSSNGNPYKAHLFSLGMTLLYAAEYNVDHTKEKISPELHDLLGRMTADSTTLRPDLESTIILCEEQLCGQSSQEVCCGIAAIAGFGLPQEDHYDDTVATGSYATEHDEFSQLESYVHDDQADTTCCDDIPDITEDVSQAESLPWSEEESLLVTGTFESTLEESVVINDESIMENRKRRRVSPQTGASSWGLNEGQTKNCDPSKSKEEMKKQKPALPKKPDNLVNSADNKTNSDDKSKGLVGDLVVSELHSESDTDHSRIDSDKTQNINSKLPKTSTSNSKTNSSEKSENKTKSKERNTSNSSKKDVTLDKNQNISKPSESVESETPNESTRKLSSQTSINDDKKVSESGKSSTDTTSVKNKRNRRKQGLTVADILDSLDRNLTEEELWALCKEGTAALQRKKKHLRK